MQAIYSPSGKAKGFAHKAINLFAGCDHLCDYCWVPGFKRKCGQIQSRAEFDIPKPRAGIIEQLRKDAAKYGDNDERVLLCFTCDPYPQDQELRKITRRALEILRKNNVPVNVLSKGGTRACADFDLYGPRDIYSATLTFCSEVKSLGSEPGAAIPYDRFSALKEAHARGIRTEVSLEPVIEPLETLGVIGETHEYVDLYKLGKLNYGKSIINWRDYAIDALSMLHSFDKPYFVKQDLADFLHGVRFKNTDTRRLRK